MQHYFPTHFYTNVPVLIIIVLMLISSGYALITYRRTIPPISIKYRIILGLLRGLAVFFILILLFAPELILVWRFESKAKIAVLVDRSASIGLENRQQEERRILSLMTEKLQDNVELIPYFFNSDTFAVNTPGADSVRFSTDIKRSLSSVSKAHPDLNALVLISDGNVSTGENPLFSNKRGELPVFTLGLGDSVAAPDISINRVQHNQFVYRNKPFEVEIEITGQGSKTKRSKLVLRRGKKVLQAIPVNVPGDGSVLAVPVTLNSATLGLNTIRTELEPLDDETILENNQKDFSVTVLKSKLKVGLIAGNPSNDVKFMQKILQDLPNVHVASAIDRPGGRTYLESITTVLDSADVLLLSDFPSAKTGTRTLTQVIAALESKGIPLIYMMLTPANKKRQDFIRGRIAIDKIRYSVEPFTAQASRSLGAGGSGSWLNIYDSDEKNDGFWEALPPLGYFVQEIEFKTGMETLALIPQTNKPLPVLLSTRGGKSKNILFIGNGFWRWKFLLAENREYSTGWQTAISNVMRWLSFKGENQNIIITAGKDEYETGESVSLTTQVYDEQFQPVKDGLVQIRVSNSDDSFDLTAEHIGEGRYTVQFPALISGDYEIEAGAWRNDVALGTAIKKISVAHLNSEFMITAQNTRLLRRLADQTGGLYADHSQAEELISKLKFPSAVKSLEKRSELWNKLFTLLLIIGLFTIEWFFRKRLGLA